MDDDGDAEWMDEDAGWKKTPVYISVPFHSRLKNPGPKEYLVGDFHHRSFVSVIRERVTNPYNDQNFHYEPFELFWKPTDNSETRVHGELYTSPAFLEAHRDLQDSPREPGCDLPRAVVAMMFCHHEVMQAQWRILLDDEFLEAYEHGIVIECCDGIKRRFYPRILTYSADYPEK
jgi:hypothetical protein